MSEPPKSLVEIFRSIDVGASISHGQISIPIKSIESAVYYALSATGLWLKEPRSRKTLDQVVRASGRELVASKAFNRVTYIDRHRTFPCHGIIIAGNDSVQDPSPSGSSVRSFAVPQLSPSDDDPPASQCLRSLTMTLLCLFRENITHQILLDTVPDHLIPVSEGNKDRFEKQGPFSAALLEYVKSVSEEEKCRKLRESLLESLEQAQGRVTSASLEDLRNCLVFETPLVVSFLSWLLLLGGEHGGEELRERVPSVNPYSFPTRSLRVWSLAYILGELGWEVEASETVINSKDTYEQYIGTESESYESTARVFLTTQAFGDDDSFAPKFVPSPTPLRRVPIRSIPRFVFEYYAFYQPKNPESKPSIDELEDIFIEAFDQLSRKLSQCSVCQDSYISGSAPQNFDGEEQLTSYQKARLKDWVEDERAQRLFAGIVTRFLDVKCPDCNASSCCRNPPFEHSTGGSAAGLRWKQDVLEQHENHRPWIVLHVIMLAFVYAVACKCLSYDTHSKADLNTEIVLTPIPFYQSGDDWSRTRLLIPDGTLLAWVQYMVKFLGMHEKSLSEIPVEESAGNTLRRVLYHMVCGKSPTKVPLLAVGCYANGLTIISKCVTAPSVGAIYRYIVQFGRPLDIPVSESGMIIGCSLTPLIRRKTTLLRKSVRHAVNGPLSECKSLSVHVRWDAEPDWEREPMEMGLRCRVHNIPRFIVNPWGLCQKKMDMFMVACRCGTRFDHTVEFPDDESWFEVDLVDYYEKGGNSNVGPLDTMKDGDHWRFFVRAGTRPLDELIALVVVPNHLASCKDTKENITVNKYVSKCLTCAGERIRSEATNRKGGVHATEKKRILSVVVLTDANSAG